MADGCVPIPRISIRCVKGSYCVEGIDARIHTRGRIRMADYDRVKVSIIDADVQPAIIIGLE